MAPNIIKHILLPSDFSVHSARARLYAYEIAKKTGAKITMLHVVNPIFDVAAESENMKEMRIKRAKERFDQLKAKRERSKFRELKVSHSIREGDIVSTILESAKSTGANLILMGSIGATGLKKVLFGSTAAEVLQKAPIPVLVIPDSEIKQDFKKFLFTTDFRQKDPQNLVLTKGIADELSGNVTVLHVAVKLDFRTEILHRGFIDHISETSGLKNLTFELREHKSILRGISEYASSEAISVIVLNRYQKSILESLAGRDTAKKMAAVGKIPLLILP